MNDGLRSVATAVALVVLLAAAYVAARYWQVGESVYQRLPVAADCDLRAGPCVQSVAGDAVRLSITPTQIPLMKTLSLRVDIDGLPADAVSVEIRGLNMDMGLNRTRLAAGADGGWSGETILPLCSQRRMEWEAAVRVDRNGLFEVPFPFVTTRP